MALTDREQQLLDQMESALAAETPALDLPLRPTGAPRRGRSRLGRRLGLTVGWVLLVVGMAAGLVVSAVGFVLMVAALVGAPGPSWQDPDWQDPGADRRRARGQV